LDGLKNYNELEENQPHERTWNMNILVTGGAGYVGSVLVQSLLSDGHCVRVLDKLMYGGDALLGVWCHEKFHFIHGDAGDSTCVVKAIDGVDAVVHLAAIVGDPACSKHKELAVATNRVASLNLLEQCRKVGVKRFIFASTCSNYGKMADPNGFIEETAELRPVSLYAETKVDVERAVLDPRKTGDVCGTALRFATVFGVSPRMRFDLTVNEFTMEMLVKKHLMVFGEQFWRPYVHVCDVARAVTGVLQAPENQVRNNVFNVGSTEQNYQKQQLVEMILRHVPDAKVEYVHKNEDPRDYRVSFAKIERELGYRTTRTVEQGILEVVELVRSGVVGDFENVKYRNI
jgi:nucleoside-diphosphate-sugar epimerase